MKAYDTIVLSGASTKGFIILGALQYLQDKELINNFNNIIGTSSGAIISYLLCIGYTPVEIVVYICTHNLLAKMQTFNMVDLVQGNGATSFHPIQEGIEKMTIAKIGYLPTLKDIKEKFGKNLIIVTHNITEDKSEYLSHKNFPELPCLVALRMSANIPLVFDHYRYGHSFYIDGGISDNFAIQLGDKIGEKVIGINLISKTNDLSVEISEIETLDYFYKLLFIPVCNAIAYKIDQASEKCDIINLKPTTNIKFFDFSVNFKLKMEMFSSGYNEAELFFKK
jgi:predicted acylesterase/phospholipase RssA